MKAVSSMVSPAGGLGLFPEWEPQGQAWDTSGLINAHAPLALKWRGGTLRMAAS